MQDQTPTPIMFLLCWPIVWSAGWLVPSGARKSWRADRRRKLFHWCAFLQENNRLNRASAMELSRACWQAFPDALWRRFDRESTLIWIQRSLRSPRLILGIGVAGLVLITIFSGFFRTTRLLLSTLPFSHPEELVSVSSPGATSPFRPGVPRRWVQMWRQESKLTQGAAEYVWDRAVVLGPHASPTALLGEVSTNLFDVLGVKPAFGRTFGADDEQSCADCVVLSYGAWQRFLGGVPDPVGKKINVNGANLTVIGVMPKGFWFLTRADTIFSVMPPATTLPPWGVPRMVAPVVRLRPGVPVADVERELKELAQLMSVRDLPKMEVLGLDKQFRQIAYPYIAMFVAGLLLTLGIGRLRLRREKAQFVDGGKRWWGFLSAKAVLFLLCAVLGAVELAPGFLRLFAGDLMVWMMSTWICLVFTVAALLLSIADQKYRCRECLFRLADPLTIGNPQRMLLERGGTELVCPEGHGLLHISASNTWDDPERWERFDSSWKAVFGEQQ